MYPLSLSRLNFIQVHDIARNFRNRWIPKAFRRHGFVDRDDGKMEFNRGSNYNRFSTSHDNWPDQSGRSTEVADSGKQSVVETPPSASIVIQEGSSATCTGGCATSETKVRKRKSRWDQPAVTCPDPSSLPNKEQKIESSSLPRMGDVTSHPENVSREGGNCSSIVYDYCQQSDATVVYDGKQNNLEDAPPGFSSCLNSLVVSYIASSTSSVIGHPQAKFVSRLPVSYGIPLSIMQQYGTPHAETIDTWVVAPGMPFHPFPPLPPCPRLKKDPSHSHDVNHVSVNQALEGQQASCVPANCHSEESTPSTTGATQADFGLPCANNQLGTKRQRESSYEAPMGRRYFKQQKWNHPKLRAPWVRDRNGWGCNGNNFRGGTNSIGVGTLGNELRTPYCSEDMSYRVEKAGNNVNQHSRHH